MHAETMGSAQGAQLVGGRYVLDDIVGDGGMSQVYRGFDCYFERDVAVKVLRAELAGDPTFRAWFRQEAQSTAALGHPSIVAIYDIGEGVVRDARVPYLVMEYVEGRTLRDILDREGAPSIERALHVTNGILRALEHSHRSGIVHRDIKPSNVMITGSGEPKVMDFGIAREVADAPALPTESTDPGVTDAAGNGVGGRAKVVGTARYLSPEQARGKRVGVHSDIYSTGCVLYELLTGTPPFTGGSSVAIAYQHVNDEPIPPSQVDPRLPVWVDEVVLRALAKDPQDRYDSAGEMRADIEHHLATDGLEAPGTRRRRRSMLWMPVAVLALLITALSGWSLASALGSVTVPNTVGSSRSAAEEQVQQRDLTPRVVLRYWEKAPKGHVFRQEPAGGTTASQNSTVRLFVSRGPRMAPVPDIAGMRRAKAAAELRDAGFPVGEVDVKPSTKPAGQVLATDPAVGVTADRELPVDLTVSTGPVEVPVVAGKAPGEARKALRGAELTIGDVVRQPSTKPSGRILGTDPSAGSAVKPGTAVNLVVSTGPVDVPKVVGQPVGAARAALQDAGLDVTKRTRATTSAKKGTVVAQRPKAGSTVVPGTTATLIVAEPPKGAKKPSAPATDSMGGMPFPPNFPGTDKKPAGPPGQSESKRNQP